MDIALDKVTEIILRLRAVEVKEGVTDPDSGSNPTDDGSIDILTSGTDDATEQEIRSMIAEQVDAGAAGHRRGDRECRDHVCRRLAR